MRLFLLALLLVTSCKGHIQDRQVSDPDFVASNDGTMLTFTYSRTIDSGFTGTFGGSISVNIYCVLQMDENNPDTSKLITTHGGISQWQLSHSLRYMGIPEQLISSSVATIAMILASKQATKKVFEAAKDAKAEKVGKIVKHLDNKPLIVAIGIVGLFHAGKVAYRVIRGKQEGESAGAQVVSALGTGVITGPVVELIRRTKRVGEAMSDKRVLRLSDKKMEKVVQRISALESNAPGTCDHLKKSSP